MSAYAMCVNDTDGDGDCAACARNPQAPCRVSARQRLKDAWVGHSAAEIDHLIDAFAHDLVQRIREPLTHEESLLVQAHVPLDEILARRIDPEATA